MSHSGVFDSQAKIVILFVLFLIFFLVILYCFKSRETSDRKLPAAPAAEEETHEITPLCVDDAALLLEEISPGAGTIFQRLFSFSRYDFVLLADAESHVIYEENGVHYISNDIVHDDKLKEGKLDSGFMELIESVVGKV